MKRIKLLYLIPALALVACEKDEPLWQLPPKGPEKVASVSMGSDYENVIFFKLSTGSKVTKALNSWDLGFNSGAVERHIILNGGNEIQVYNTHDTDFTKTYPATLTSAWQWDNPNGKNDSTAIGNWCDTTGTSLREVYVLDLGRNITPRYRKIRFLEVNGSSYRLQCVNMDNTGFYEATVVKNTACAYTYFNCSSRAAVNFEPENNSWDIVFTRYRHVYYDLTPVTPYYVTGVRIDSRHVRVAETTTIPFEAMNAAKAAQLEFSKAADGIGYQWKYYDMTAAKYLINDFKVYVLQDQDGFYYKLRFIDFYDEQGAKGHPRFAYQRL